jgi:hypothetical protein
VGPVKNDLALNSGRSIELKQRFYKTLVDRLHEGANLRKEDGDVSNPISLVNDFGALRLQTLKTSLHLLNLFG